jgi:hypothetical protein
MEPLLDPMQGAVREALVSPRPLGTDEWALIARLLHNLFLFSGVGLAGLLALLLGHGILPARVLVASSDPALPMGGWLRGVRWALYPVAVVNLALAAWFFWRVLVFARAVMLQYYPRWLI